MQLMSPERVTRPTGVGTSLRAAGKETYSLNRLLRSTLLVGTVSMVSSKLLNQNGVIESTGNGYLNRHPVAGTIPISIQPSGVIKSAKIGNLNFLHYLRQSSAKNRQLSNNPGTNLHSETITNNRKILSKRRLLTKTRRCIDDKSECLRHKHPINSQCQ